jgi:Tol biopolymer transport system component
MARSRSKVPRSLLWLFAITLFLFANCKLRPEGISPDNSTGEATTTAPTNTGNSATIAVSPEDDEGNYEGEEPAEPKCLTPGAEFHPSRLSWSPDSQRLAYVYVGYLFAPEIANATENSATSQMQPLTDSNPQAIQIAWSPNGDYLAFVSEQDGIFVEGGWQIYLRDMNTGAVRRLTNSPRTKDDVVWSPNGRYLAYSTYRLDTFDEAQIRVMDVYNNEEIVLTQFDFKGHDVPFSWSPDSQYLAYHSTRDGYETVQIFITDLSGNNHTQLSGPAACDAQPRWSPDGERIAFVSLVDDQWELFVMKADGSERTRLTNSPGTDEYDPAWSPDGKQIAFVAWNWSIPGSETSSNTYLVNVDGSHLRPLTHSGLMEQHFVWSPDGQYIAYEARAITNTTPIYIDLVDVQSGKRITFFRRSGY